MRKLYRYDDFSSLKQVSKIKVFDKARWLVFVGNSKQIIVSTVESGFLKECCKGRNRRKDNRTS